MLLLLLLLLDSLLLPLLCGVGSRKQVRRRWEKAGKGGKVSKFVYLEISSGIRSTNTRVPNVTLGVPSGSTDQRQQHQESRDKRK